MIKAWRWWFWRKKRKLFKMTLCCLALLSQRNLLPLMLQPLCVKHQWHTGEAVTPQETQPVIVWGVEYQGTWTNASFLKCAVEQVHFLRSGTKYMLWTSLSSLPGDVRRFQDLTTQCNPCLLQNYFRYERIIKFLYL